MRTLLILFQFAFFVSCNRHADKEANKQSTSDSITPDTSFKNSGVTYKITLLDLGSDKLILTASSETLLNRIDTLEKAAMLAIKYPDFDNDGNADILIDYIGNNSSYFLYLFDPSTKRFRAIEGYVKFPDAVQLDSNKKYYYSYHRAGCADANWVSDLIRIENYRIVHLGHIYGQGCDNPMKISISKVLDNNEEKMQPVETIPYGDIDKWEFIKEYWNKNLGRFE